MKKYTVKFEKKAIKNLKSIDISQAKLILTWIDHHLDGTTDPRKHGKPLKGKLNEYWRYRIGQYRIVVDIQDEQLIIVVISLGHRKEIYLK